MGINFKKHESVVLIKEPSSSDASQSPAREKNEKKKCDETTGWYLTQKNLELLYLINIYESQAQATPDPVLDIGQ